MGSRTRFEGLKMRSLHGDTAATFSIFESFSNRALSFADINPILSHHLSEANFVVCSSQSEASNDWPSLPTTANARTCLKILTYVCDDGINMFALPSSVVSFITPLIPLYIKWLILFLEWTGILLDIPNLRADASVADILFEVSSVAQALSMSPPVRRIVAAHNVLFPTMLKVWFHLCTVDHPEKMMVQNGILMHLMVNTGEQHAEGSMVGCMNAAAEDVGKALLKCLFDEVFFQQTVSLRSLSTCLNIMQFYTDPTGVFHRTLLTNGVSRVLCHAARRISKSQSDNYSVSHSLSSLGSQLSLCSWTRQTVSEALRSHIVVTLLRMEVFYETGRHDATEWQHYAVATFASLAPFLMYRSLFRLFLRAIKDVDAKGLEDLLVPNGTVRGAYAVFKAEVESRRLALDRYTESNGFEGPSICVNPTCAFEMSARGRASRCAGCLFARYCSEICQRIHWRSGHREECPRLASAARIGFPPPPPSPQDMHYIFYELEIELTRNRPTILGLMEEFDRTRATRHLHEGHKTMVLRVEYGGKPPVAEVGVRFSISGLEDLRLEIGSVEGSAYWEERVSRATEPGDPYVALMISGHLVHLTNMKSIKKRVYPVHVDFKTHKH